MADRTDPHDHTVEVYRHRAADWERRGRPRVEDAAAFASTVLGSSAHGAVVDLGCGPGWHLPHLPPRTIAVDAAETMLDRVPRYAPDAPRLQADLRALPFARGSLDAVWANKSYVHLRRSLLPLAWWDLHRAMRVGAHLYLGVFGGDLEHGEIDDGEFAGRTFSGWPPDLLEVALHGAGFSVHSVVARRDGAVDHLAAWAVRERTLADTVGPDMRLLLVGLNPSLVAADAGVGFFRAGNRAWPALLAAGLATVDRDPLHLLTQHRIGMTDLVKRATPRADALHREELARGVARLDRLCAWLRPGAVCVLGITGWRQAVDPAATVGLQPRELGGRPVYVMPNPSGANAHVRLEDVVEHLRAAAAHADGAPGPRDWSGAAP